MGQQLGFLPDFCTQQSLQRVFDSESVLIYPMVMTNIAIENGPLIDDFHINTSIYKGFSMAMLNNQMVL